MDMQAYPLGSLGAPGAVFCQQDREVSGSHSGINRRGTGTGRKCCRFLKIFSNHLSVGVDLCYTDGARQKSFRLARRYGTSKAQKGMILWQEKIIEEEI